MDLRWRRDPPADLVRDLYEARAVPAGQRDDDGAARLRELFQREERRAFAVALRLLRDAALAEDAVQEAFTQLWEQADRFDLAGGRLEGLLMTVVRRRAIDLARRQRDQRLPDPDLLEQVDDAADAMLERVEEELTHAGLRSLLRGALAALPPEQRTIVAQAYFGERTLREIAAREGLPLGTVKSRLRLAMAKLNQSLRWRAP
jgi:RNA polymerase sigma-70 factor (ECF subfamily)